MITWLKIIIVPVLCLLCIRIADGGWTEQSSGTLAWLHSVHFVSRDIGWAVGGGGIILKTSDGGKSWAQVKRFTADNIRDVYFSDERNGWLLCERDIYKVDSGSPSYLLKTADGGANWERLSVDGGRDRIVRLFFAKSGRGFGVGENGAIWKMQEDKKVWKSSALPVPFLMLDGTFTNELSGLMVGGGGTILYTDDGGSSWNKATLTDDAKMKLSSVFFADTRTGWTVGGAGKIYFTNNAGKLWREQVSGSTENLFDVFFMNPAEGFAVGDNGTILSTTTAGNTWKLEQTVVKHRLERLFFIGKKGFAVGYGGTILTYDEQK